MNKTFYCLLVLLLWCGKNKAQNFIFNGDFETFSNCPANPGELFNCQGWVKPTVGTPDYLNACGGPDADVPLNYWGTETAHSGNAYAGLIIGFLDDYPINNWREYMQTQLTGSLVPGTSYNLKMYLSLADDESKWASDAIGALFSTTAISKNDNFRFTQIPQAHNASGNIISNKNGWTQITMSFVADSAYNYVTIGNFSDSAYTTMVPVAGGFKDRCYFYIDDVSLSVNSEIGFSEIVNEISVSVFPNPCVNLLTVTAKEQNVLQFVLHDLSGRIVRQISFSGNAFVNTETLSAGFYFYEIVSNGKTIKKGKVVKE